MQRTNTAMDEVSRGVPDSATLTDEDKAKIRSQTMEKVNTRLGEVTDRVGLIDKAVLGSLADIIAQHPLGEAVDVLVAFDDKVCALEKAVSELKARVAYAKEVSMPTRMDDEQCKTFNTDTARITRTGRTFASMLDTEAGMKWLRDNGYEALIKETVNASSLSGAAKELMENGKELPDDIFKVHIKDSVSITWKR